MVQLWLKSDGSLLENSSNQLIDCPNCPCTPCVPANLLVSFSGIVQCPGCIFSTTLSAYRSFITALAGMNTSVSVPIPAPATSSTVNITIGVAGSQRGYSDAACTTPSSPIVTYISLQLVIYQMALVGSFIMRLSAISTLGTAWAVFEALFTLSTSACRNTVTVPNVLTTGAGVTCWNYDTAYPPGAAQELVIATSGNAVITVTA